MKKIINGKLYDTDTARVIGEDSYSTPRDFNYWGETLYVKRTGEYFLYGEGGPMSRYSRSTGNNEWSGGEQIIPLTYDKARQWAKEHLTADEYAEAFGMPDEDAEDADLHIKVPAALMTAVQTEAVKAGVSVSAFVRQVLEAKVNG